MLQSEIVKNAVSLIQSDQNQTNTLGLDVGANRNVKPDESITRHGDLAILASVCLFVRLYQIIYQIGKDTQSPPQLY